MSDTPDALHKLITDLAQALHETNLRSEGLCAFCSTRSIWRDGPVYEHEPDCEGEALFSRVRKLGLEPRS